MPFLLHFLQLVFEVLGLSSIISIFFILCVFAFFLTIFDIWHFDILDIWHFWHFWYFWHCTRVCQNDSKGECRGQTLVKSCKWSDRRLNVTQWLSEWLTQQVPEMLTHLKSKKRNQGRLNLTMWKPDNVTDTTSSRDAHASKKAENQLLIWVIGPEEMPILIQGRRKRPPIKMGST